MWGLLVCSHLRVQRIRSHKHTELAPSWERAPPQPPGSRCVSIPVVLSQDPTPPFPSPREVRQSRFQIPVAAMSLAI